jgi:hypothetical protein
MRRTFDFHEMGLVLEFEYPRNIEVSVLQTKGPRRSAIGLVEIDSLRPGESVYVHLGEDYAVPRVLMLEKRSRDNANEQLECRWTKGENI